MLNKLFDGINKQYDLENGLNNVCYNLLLKKSQMVLPEECPGPALIEQTLQDNYIAFKEQCNIGIVVSISSLISVICQFAFNLKSKQQVPFDKWSVLDLLNSVVNVSVLQIFNMLTAKDFTDPQTRQLIIIMNLLMVVVSWTRFISFFLVISSISKLLMTLSKMITNAATFLFITFCYLIMMVPIFGTLYQD
jgi:hypothetical protein